MTTPVAIVPVTFDSVDLCPDDLSRFFRITQGLNEPPDLRGVDVVVPGLDGQVTRPRRANTLRIVLFGHVMGVGSTQGDRRSSFRTEMAYLRDDLFSPARTAAELAATLENGLIATLDARPLPGMMVNELVPSEFAEVSIELLSVTPDWTYTLAGS
jgi:hypothetical protein